MLADGIDDGRREVPLPCDQPADLGVMDAEHGALGLAVRAILVAPPLLDLGVDRCKRAGQCLRTQSAADRMAPEGVVVEAETTPKAAGHARSRDGAAHRAQAEDGYRLGNRSDLPAAAVER